MTQTASNFTNTEGAKFDGGKARYDLIPPEALDALAQLYGVGAAKYADRNWEKGIKYSRVFAALMRHAWAWWRGEKIDPETGLSHMTSVAWNAFSLFTYDARRMEEFNDNPALQAAKPASPIVVRSSLSAA